MTRKLILAAVCAGFALPAAAHADQVSDLAALHAQMLQMQKDYAARMAALEKRLIKAEAEAKAAKQSASVASTTAKSAAASAKAITVRLAAVPPLPATTPPPTPAAAPATVLAEAAPQVPTADQTAAMVEPPPATAPSAPPSSLNAFNPGIAAVLNGFYFAASRNPAGARIAGIAPGDDIGLQPRGFSIGESEVSLTANIDPFMSGFLDISFQNDNTPAVEEAYILSKDLPYGLTLKGGRFLSGVGYINERHAHDWLFSDAPLPYRAFLNNQYGDDGLQLRWLAPTDQFLEFGAEVFRGDVYPAAGSPHSGTGTFTAFVNTGNDFNDSSSWLAKASYLHSDAMNRDSNGHLFSGITQLGILSGVYKWAPGGNPTVNNLTLTSEVFVDRQAGFYDGVRVSQDRWGGYVQGMYQFMPRWSVGLRYAQLGTAPVPLPLMASDLDDLGHASRASTAMLEFDTSEFGRLRASYTHDEAGFKPIDELVLQYTVIYGPHGAHRY
jgi:hypothetical protein